MAKCSSCAAPLPQGTIICEYCGSRNDIDLRGIHYYTTHESDSLRACPRCAIPLKTIDLQLEGKFLIERCDHCLGLFFDPGELEALLQATVRNVFAINRKQLESLNAPRRACEYGISYVKCPVCAKLMNRVNFGTKSGVVVDRCKEHGVWLDGGELRHLFEWMKAGGRLLHQEKEAQLKKDEQREEPRRNLQQQTFSGGSYTEDDSFSLFGTPLRNADPDLFAIVTKAIRFFTR